jgi:AcrR family transcriptional regulator
MRLFQIATDIIGKRGTREFSLRELSKKAGYSSALAGMKFGTKEEFLIRLMREGSRHWSDDVAAKLAEDGGKKAGLEALDTGLIAYEDWCRDRNDALAQTLIFFELVSGKETTRKVVAEGHQAARDAMREWIEQAIEQNGTQPMIAPAPMAALFQALVFGLCVSWMIDPEDVPLPALFADVRRAWYVLLGCQNKL